MPAKHSFNLLYYLYLMLLRGKALLTVLRVSFNCSHNLQLTLLSHFLSLATYSSNTLHVHDFLHPSLREWLKYDESLPCWEIEMYLHLCGQRGERKTVNLSNDITCSFKLAHSIRNFISAFKKNSYNICLSLEIPALISRVPDKTVLSHTNSSEGLHSTKKVQFQIGATCFASGLSSPFLFHCKCHW